MPSSSPATAAANILPDTTASALCNSPSETLPCLARGGSETNEKNPSCCRLCLCRASPQRRDEGEQDTPYRRRMSRGESRESLETTTQLSCRRAAAEAMMVHKTAAASECQKSRNAHPSFYSRETVMCLEAFFLSTAEYKQRKLFFAGMRDFFQPNSPLLCLFTPSCIPSFSPCQNCRASLSTGDKEETFWRHATPPKPLDAAPNRKHASRHIAPFRPPTAAAALTAPFPKRQTLNSAPTEKRRNKRREVMDYREQAASCQQAGCHFSALSSIRPATKDAFAELENASNPHLSFAPNLSPGWLQGATPAEPQKEAFLKLPTCK
ncbi:hypothetical protein cyc_08079 [Cyclospora cayetanensis]|uniref:Uncharacterized protein n=1 Tax=Cyclospora cayetanensis TaxID=88456 RepID=A0A1D3D3N0_9EIME|nr:hypothetical protein cyc_08079 [Cyclospora cayetanensis]